MEHLTEKCVIRFTPAQLHRLRTAAQKDGRTLSGYIRYTIISFLAEQEKRRK